MTKKHFEQAAAIARGTDVAHREAVAQAFVALFRSHNPRFDVARFLDACGVGQ